MFQIIDLDHIALTVRDQERSLEWYQRVLGMERRYEARNTLYTVVDELNGGSAPASTDAHGA